MNTYVNKVLGMSTEERMKNKPFSSIDFSDSDGYKISHYLQDPEDLKRSSRYIAARVKGDYTIFYGMQGILNSLKVPTLDEVELIKYIFDNYYVGDEIFDYEGWKKVAELGYYPLEVHTVQEGSKVPTGNILVRIEPTIDGMDKIAGWLENKMLRVWYPTTVATYSYKVKEVILKYLIKNGTPETLDWKLVDFGSRGVSSKETAEIGGAAHLINFKASDTISGMMYALDNYGADFELLSSTIGASEHSTTTIYGRTGEPSFYEKMVKVFGQAGRLFANVIDSYDQEQALYYIKDIFDTIEASGATMVIRLDSGDPVDNPVMMTQKALEIFGYKINNKGYKVLPDCIRLLQGDGVTLDNIESILSQLDKLGISADNIAFGMGGKLLQDHNRDSYGFALKRSWALIGDVEVDVFKMPKSDPTKASMAGRLTLVTDTNGDYVTKRVEEVLTTDTIMLQPMWRNSKFVNIQKFSDIRNITESTL